jgi:hypothetical protein
MLRGVVAGMGRKRLHRKKFKLGGDDDEEAASASPPPPPPPL